MALTGDSAAAPAASPCTGVCRIDGHSGLCAGCARSLDEIARWRGMGEAERLQVLARLRGRTTAQDAVSPAGPWQTEGSPEPARPAGSGPLPVD